MVPFHANTTNRCPENVAHEEANISWTPSVCCIPMALGWAIRLSRRKQVERFELSSHRS